MKTIEQKALAYDEAKKVIKDNLDALNEITETGANVVNIQSIKNCFYRAFPELAESEDEKIRKEIISFIQDHIDEINLQVSGDYDTRDKEDIALQEWCKKAIAWLENIPITIDHEKREGFRLGYKAGLEKQGNKPAWSEEDAFRASALTDVVKSGGSIRPELRNEFVDWLKSIKERVQPIHEYSDTEKQEVFLRSQRPHFWRPSDEQMKALKYVAYHLMPDNNYREEMFSLYEDLKKLK